METQPVLGVCVGVMVPAKSQGLSLERNVFAHLKLAYELYLFLEMSPLAMVMYNF